MGREGGILPTIVSTAFLTLVALAIASPIGIGAAVYIAEYLRATGGRQLYTMLPTDVPRITSPGDSDRRVVSCPGPRSWLICKNSETPS